MTCLNCIEVVSIVMAFGSFLWFIRVRLVVSVGLELARHMSLERVLRSVGLGGLELAQHMSLEWVLRSVSGFGPSVSLLFSGIPFRLHYHHFHY